MRKITILVLVAAMLTSIAVFLFNKTTSWKVYRNNDYHFVLSIPSSWSTKTGVDGNGYPSFSLSSKDGKITIQNFFNGKHLYNQGDGTFDPELQIGSYKTLGAIYESTDTEKIIRLDLYHSNTPKHQDLFLYVFVYGKYNDSKPLLQKVLKTFAYTQDDPSIESFISYSLPNGWKKQEGDDTQGLIFVSSDATLYGTNPWLKTGARIYVSYIQKPNKNQFSKIVTIGDLSWHNGYNCSEGCIDMYSVTHRNNTFNIDFNCAGLAACSSIDKNVFNTTPYAKDRDYFLNSIKFK